MSLTCIKFHSPRATHSAQHQVPKNASQEKHATDFLGRSYKSEDRKGTFHGLIYRQGSSNRRTRKAITKKKTPTNQTGREKWRPGGNHFFVRPCRAATAAHYGDPAGCAVVLVGLVFHDGGRIMGLAMTTGAGVHVACGSID